MSQRKYQCTECDSTHTTFNKAARCHYGIGGVIELDAEGNVIQEEN